MFKSALLVAASIVVGAGAVQLLHAAENPPLYTVAEINVKDRAAYEKELPAVLKVIKEGGGEYLTGGFDKAKLDYGGPPVGNRYVIVRYDNADAYNKTWRGGLKKWSTILPKRISPASG